ncbi:tetratricopeptide repeat protein [Kitasatospora sp. NPDC056181]|uniref:tetratricopeptide repeat protein n=1 Tax=Kitasatospora sp. NPDC056181 TaxID=3345737 RepID=UPI0035D67C11
MSNEAAGERSIAAQNITNAFTGDIAGQYGDYSQQHNYFHSPPRTPVRWPHQVGVLPPRADCFRDRAETAWLKTALASGGTAVVESADAVPTGGVLVGMGGVGKTQLAADYARTVWQAGELDVLVWITASNRSAAVTGYAQAATALLAADPTDPQAAAEAFLAWLEPAPQRPACRWLIVLDDVTDPADLHGLWPPTSPTGRTLATTRRKDAALTGHHRRMIEVGLFIPAEALAYLTNALATHQRHEPEQQLAGLAEDLGHLPLALAQAAAYLVDADISCADYRALLADRATTLTDASPEALPDGQTHTMAAAWALSIERADALRPAGLAQPMLQLAAFLDPNGIPTDVLTSEPALAHLTSHRGVGPQVTAGQAAQALRALNRLSLIDHTPRDQRHAVRVHQLIQRAVRDTLIPDQHQRLARTAADALIAVWPAIERDTALAAALRANTAALITCADEELHRPHEHLVLQRIGRSLGESGQAAAARDHFHHLTTVATHHLGSEHPVTLAHRGTLAYWQGAAGDSAGATAAFADLLPALVQVLGTEHPDTLTTQANLASLRGRAGDPVGATKGFTELLNDQIRILGPDHPDTLSTRANLAHWQGTSGDPTGATKGYAGLLNDQVRVLGPDHPDTLYARGNLAHWQGKAGDPAGAATALAALLKDQVRVLGPDHPDTLSTRARLARLRGEAGDPGGAATALAELLSDRIRVLGPDHPDTLITQGNLAHWRGEVRRMSDEALDIQR